MPDTQTPPALENIASDQPNTASGFRVRQLFSPIRQYGLSRKAVHFDGSPDDVIENYDRDHFADRQPILHYEVPVPVLSGPVSAHKSSRRNRLSRSLSIHAEKVSTVLYRTSEPPTVVHRSKLQLRPTIPRIDTNVDRNPQSLHEHESAVIAHGSSSTPSVFRDDSVSPMSKTSTGQTSIFASSHSFRSQKSVESKQAQDLHQSPNRTYLPCTEELAPIEESGTHYLTIPCQEAPVGAKPSVVTVEAATAAKVFFEIHFNSLLSDSASPRSIRRRRLEQEI